LDCKKDPARHIELAVKGKPLRAVLRAPDKALADAGHAAAGFLAQNLRAGGHVPPAQKLHALLGHDDLQHLLGLGTLEGVRGEEEHPHAVVPGSAQFDARGGGGLCHQAVGHLNHQAHAVAGFAGGVLSGPVLQLFHDLQCPVHGVVGLNALDAHHGADAAGVVFKIRPIQPPLSRGRLLLCCFRHSFLPFFPIKAYRSR
jgi:hypothetical protein